MLDEVSVHLTLIIKSYGVSRFSAVVAVPHQIASSREAEIREMIVHTPGCRSAGQLIFKDLVLFSTDES